MAGSEEERFSYFAVFETRLSLLGAPPAAPHFAMPVVPRPVAAVEQKGADPDGEPGEKQAGRNYQPEGQDEPRRRIPFAVPFFLCWRRSM